MSKRGREVDLQDGKFDRDDLDQELANRLKELVKLDDAKASKLLTLLNNEQLLDHLLTEQASHEAPTTTEELHAEGEAAPARKSGGSASEPESEEAKKHESQSQQSAEAEIRRHIGKITGEIVATTLGQGKIFEKIHDRAGTNAADGEGDHITASAVLNEIIHNFLEDKSCDEAMNQLPRLMSSLGLDQSHKDRIEEILKLQKDFLDQNHLALTKENRYKLTQDLRQIGFIAKEAKQDGATLKEAADKLGLTKENRVRLKALLDPAQTLPEDQIVEVRECLKYARRAANAGTIAAISEEMVHVLNHQKDPPSALSKKRNPTGCHTRDENETMKNLRLFNAICGLVNEFKELDKETAEESADQQAKKVEQQKAILDEFKEDVKAIMRYSYPNTSKQATIDANFQKFMEGFFGTGHSLNSTALQNIDGSWVNGITSALQTNANYTAKLGECFNNLYDYGYVDDPRRYGENDVTILYKSSARHVSYLFNAFSNLKTLPDTKRQEVKDGFFDGILGQSSSHEEGGRKMWDSKGQGWGEFLVEEGQKLDKVKLESEVSKYLKSDYQFSKTEVQQQSGLGGAGL